MKKNGALIPVILLTLLILTAYAIIIALGIGGFFLTKDLLVPFYSTNTIIKLSVLAGSLAFAIGLVLTLMVLKRRTTTLFLLLLSTIIGLGMIIASGLALFPIYGGAAKIIFGWQSFFTGLGLATVTLVMAFACSSRLSETTTITWKSRTAKTFPGGQPFGDYSPGWSFGLAIKIISIFTVIGLIMETAKRYRSFLKVLAVSVLCLLLGRLIILEFQLVSKESQAIVWYGCGFLAYLYLGRKLIKSQRKSAIFALLATSVTAGTILTVFSALTFFNLYATVSQAILTWPALISLVVLALLIFAGYDLYYRSLPDKSYREQIREWLKSGKEVLDGGLLIVIILLIELLGFLSGVVILIFQACLSEKFLALSSELKNTGAAILGISALALFLTVLGIITFIIRENATAEITANMTPEEKKEFELREAQAFIDMTASGRNPLNNPFNL